MSSSTLSRGREMVLPTVSLAQLLLALLKRYEKRFNNRLLHGRAITQADCQEIVAAYWEEIITGRLHWMGGAISADTVIERIIPGYTEKEFVNQAVSLRDEVLWPVLDICEEAICEYIPARSWKMWTIRPFAAGHHILEEGDDFRIYEWERMLREKQISYPHIVLPDDNSVTSPEEVGITDAQLNGGVDFNLPRRESQALYRRYRPLEVLTGPYIPTANYQSGGIRRIARNRLREIIENG